MSCSPSLPYEKTTLVRNYLRWIKRWRPALSGKTLYLDLMECTNRDADGYSRFITRAVSPRHVDGVPASGFVAFFRAMSAEGGALPNLILDEMDDLCLDSHALDLVSAIARERLVRLVACGRGDLFRMLIGEWSHLANRLQLLRLGPLDTDSARRLLIDPLRALGFSFAETTAVDRILFLTGRFPHLIQLFARELAEYLIGANEKVLTPRALDDLQWDFELAQYFVSPIWDIRHPLSRLVAFTILRDHDHDVWTPAMVAEMIRGVTVERANDTLNELFIGNILTWHGGAFRVANGALQIYARHLGILEKGYEEAQQAWSHRRRIETV